MTKQNSKKKDLENYVKAIKLDIEQFNNMTWEKYFIENGAADIAPDLVIGFMELRERYLTAVPAYGLTTDMDAIDDDIYFKLPTWYAYSCQLTNILVEIRQQIELSKQTI